MGTADIKNALIEKVMHMGRREAASLYVRIVEQENAADKDLYEHWEDIPAEHKEKILSGIKNLQEGKFKTFAGFTEGFRKKYKIAK